MFAVMTRFLLILVLLSPIGASAQADIEAQAREALALMGTAVSELDEAESARDRVKALSAAISAHETGLAALRSGLRQISAREAILTAQLKEQDDEIAALLGALLRLRTGQTPIMLAHPAGPVGSVRGGMLLSEIVPALTAQAETLRADTEEVVALRKLQDTAIVQLQLGLQSLRTAREELNRAIADRTDLPKRFVNDPVREAVLIASAENMTQFADGLDRITEGQIALSSTETDLEKGSLPLPVVGQLKHAAGEADAAGVVRPGLLMEVLPNALVTSPSPATIRYTGPLLDYGQVVILEPQRDLLFIFAGLETVYVSGGDVIDSGAPIGLIGGGADKNAAQQSTDGEGAGAQPTETLYIEVRQENAPEDPSLWFRMDKDG